MRPPNPGHAGEFVRELASRTPEGIAAESEITLSRRRRPSSMICSAGRGGCRLRPMKVFRILRSVTPLLLLGATWGQPAKQERREIFDYLSELTGQQFKRCGGYAVGVAGWEETQKRVLNCAVTAAMTPEPFYFYENGLNVDSVYFQGWVKTAKGSLLSYNYDSAPCGNSNCQERFTTRPCPDPNLYMQGRWLKFRCDRSAN